MRVSVVVLLLLGAYCLLAAAEDAKPAPAAEGEAVPAYGKYGTGWKDKDKHGKDGKDGYDGRDGKDGRPGTPGPPGPPGKDGRDGHDGRRGRPGRDGRDAWITITYKTGEKEGKVNITNNDCEAKHVIGQISSKATCDVGYKATACSCDTGLSSSIGSGFMPPRETDYGATGSSWIQRANYIVLVKNALSGSEPNMKETCTCVGQYAATVRGRHGEEGSKDCDDYEYYSGSGSGSKRSGDSDDKRRRLDEYRRRKYDDEYHAKMAGKYDDDYFGYYGEHGWIRTAPRWQYFEITATVTCERVKMVPHRRRGGEHDWDKDGSKWDDDKWYDSYDEKDYDKDYDKDDDKDYDSKKDKDYDYDSKKDWDKDYDSKKDKDYDYDSKKEHHGKDHDKKYDEKYSA